MFRDVEWRRPFKIEECHEDNVMVIRAELPGVDPERDVQVDVVDDQLVITAQKSESHEKSARHVHHSEFRYGSMTRSVSMPKGVDESMISATYEDGVLEVRVAMPAASVMEGGTGCRLRGCSRHTVKVGPRHADRTVWVARSGVARTVSRGNSAPLDPRTSFWWSRRVHETDEDIAQLQMLLDESDEREGSHLREVLTAERRLSARTTCDRLVGMRLLALATVSGDGRPLVGPVDGIFF